MQFAIKLSPAAVEDLKEAFDFYEIKSNGLGDRFLNQAENSFYKIANTPGIGSPRYADIRCTIIQNFLSWYIIQ